MTGAQRQTTKYEVQKQTHKKYVIKGTCEASAERTGDPANCFGTKASIRGEKKASFHMSQFPINSILNTKIHKHIKSEGGLLVMLYFKTVSRLTLLTIFHQTFSGTSCFTFVEQNSRKGSKSVKAAHKLPNCSPIMFSQSSWPPVLVTSILFVATLPKLLFPNLWIVNSSSLISFTFFPLPVTFIAHFY